MISLRNVSMLYGSRLLFDEVSLNLLPGLRYGLVGANGAGKSTLLKLITGEEIPSLGDIVVAKQCTIGILKQDHFRYEDDTLVQVVLQGKDKLWQALQEKEILLKNNIWDEKAISLLGTYEETIGHYQGYMAEGFAQKLLTGLGIPTNQHFNKLKTLSGGYKLRVLLAQTLFSEPDILLLDEPTNHLDIMSIAWLEDYLKSEFKGLLIFISHDQDFLDNLSTHILDIDYGEIREYVGNYHKFLKEKELVLTQKILEAKHLERKISHLQSFVDRFKAKASKARQAHSREKMIERIELPDIKQSSRISPNFSFKQQRPSGKQVISIKGLSKSFGEKNVLKNIGFTLHREEKVGLIGHNGIGKSTLLKVIMGQLQADSGEYEWGYETHISYFAQDHHELLKEPATLLDWLTDKAPQSTSSAVRAALGQVLFTKDDVDKNVLQISGGEASRLLLAKIMLEQGNVLLLDEPTNHLDLEARNALAKALKEFKGTVLFVSHDRHFVNEVANRIIALSESGIKDYKGKYSDYLTYYGKDYLNREWLKHN